MNFFATNRRVLISIAAGVALGAILLFFFAPPLVVPFCVAGVLIAVVWFGSNALVRRLRRGKQRRFDAGVAAREGIEDRKREWTSWTKELEQQGIDRYDLPFYLLVGEPQSGKSVLLQNSDLSFPFGQSRLSGIGGTRGCDWWFTEEAVILDLAGRLFTHEGGASDEAEWAAFLEMLAAYRPICPANGLMLVLPCDSLLKDDREESTRKANKIQNALLTLTGKLQAQIPIYVILTKGDRIFGFAETVHRLETEQRQQMFGWSRPAESFEATFDIVEVRRAFGQMVGRARTLRDTMMATVRLPEGLHEVDRMMAFADELEGIGSTLELYLKRIFSDSNLVDRLYFRGFYLTSGLQTGTPIANVCAELLGTTGEADLRDLSALFTKQQAYFIKDLVRRRVFSERGLVRPTQRRVAKARRNAWLGYGAAASIAVVSVIASAAYVFTEYSAGELNKFRQALRVSAESANAEAPEAAELLKALDATWEAKKVAPRSLESAGVNRAQSFERLYASLCDARFTPELRRLAEEKLEELAAAGQVDVADHTSFLRRSRQLALLAGGFDPGDRAQVEMLEDLLPPSLVSGAKRALARRVEITSEIPVPASKFDPARTVLASAPQRIEELWARTLYPQAPQQIAGPAGYLVAWEGLLRSYRALDAAQLAAMEKEHYAPFQRDAALYHDAHAALSDPLSTSALKRSDKQWILLKNDVVDAFTALGREREALRRARGAAEPAEWPELASLLSFTENTAFARASLLPEGRGAGDVIAAMSGPKILVPNAELLAAMHAPLARVCDPAVLAHSFDPSGSNGKPNAELLAQMPGDVQRAIDAARVTNDRGLARKVVQIKCAMLAEPYLAHCGNAPSLGAALSGGGTRPQQTLVPVLEHAVALERALRAVAEGDAAAQQRLDLWIAALGSARAAALVGARAEVGAWSEDPASGADAALLGALGKDGSPDAQSLALIHLDAEQRKQIERWRAEDGAKSNAQRTVEIVTELDDHVQRTAAYGTNAAVDQALGAWLSNDVRPLLEQRLALHEADLRAASPALKEMTSLTAAVGVIKRELKPQQLRVWHEKLTGEWRVLDGAPIAERLLRLERRAEIAAPIGELARKSARTTDFADFVKQRAQWLDDRTIAFQTATDGGPLAVALRDLRAARLGRSAGTSTLSFAADWYVDQMFARLDALAVERVRELYRADVERKIGPHLALALFAGAAELGGLAAKRDAIAAELTAFLGPDGEFDKLQGLYLQDGQLAFRPARDEVDGASFFAFDHFVRELRQFLSAEDEPKKALDRCTIDIAMAPVGIKEADSVWMRCSYLFTCFRIGDPNSFFDFAQLNDGTRLGPLAWSFAPTSTEQVWLRWSRSASALPPGKTQNDDADLRVGSPLAPLVMAWALGKPLDDARSSKRWEIAWTCAKPAQDTRARFVLDFARPLPARPSYRFGT